MGPVVRCGPGYTHHSIAVVGIGNRYRRCYPLSVCRVSAANTNTNTCIVVQVATLKRVPLQPAVGLGCGVFHGPWCVGVSLCAATVCRSRTRAHTAN
eukprot:scaffold281929_cov30-Tisochrysis_lutea.AAC.3